LQFYVTTDVYFVLKTWRPFTQRQSSFPRPNKIDHFVHNDGDRKTKFLSLSLPYLYGPLPLVWRDILIFKKVVLFLPKSRPKCTNIAHNFVGKMWRDTLANHLCVIRWHFSVPPRKCHVLFEWPITPIPNFTISNISYFSVYSLKNQRFFHYCTALLFL